MRQGFLRRATGAAFAALAAAALLTVVGSVATSRAAAPRLGSSVALKVEPGVDPAVVAECREALATAWPDLVAQAWPFDGARPHIEILLLTARGFRARTSGHGTDWDVGLASGGRAWVDVERPLGPGGSASRVLLHETVHCLLFEAMPGVGDVPVWFHEGVAQLLSGEWRFRDTVSLVLDGDIPDLDGLESGFPADRGRADQAYRTSLLAVQALRRWYGDDVIPRLIRETRSTGSFIEAFRTTTGVAIWEFQGRFGNELRQRYGWLVNLTRWPDLFALLAVAFVVGAVAKRRRDRRRFDALDEPDAGA